jgi:hypothetical protein
MDDNCPALPAYAEIANIEHELAFLRERQATMQRRARLAWTITVWGFWITLIAASAGLLTAMQMNNGDAAAKLFLVVLLLAIGGVATWLFGDAGWGYEETPRPYPFGSEKQFFEHAIAARERRLKELKAQR